MLDTVTFLFAVSGWLMSFGIWLTARRLAAELEQCRAENDIHAANREPGPHD